ncbi:DUF3830 family protein [Halovivax gelatinilyticus]|uniref:DUF3830 family protein n=1 Tax=Halovivax gelatinilyticus TaxID=2961597 RepID=UPI0020CA4786|nr:DUF3830 family protein [Halovivax gelatinilyticus]
MVTPPSADGTTLALSFEGGETVPVVLREERSPETCAAICDALPIEELAYHSRWSGREVNVSVSVDSTIPPEDRTAHTSVGDVVYWRDWQLPTEEAPEAIAVYYGPETTRGPQGPLSVTPFGHVPPAHWEPLESVGERIWREGGERLTLRVDGE